MNNELYFITGNAHKLREAQALLPTIKQLDIDLPEEQSLDPQLVISRKLAVAATHHDGEHIVEDTSLYLDGLNGFPGPLIKWMLQSVGPKGIYDLCHHIHNTSAVARTVIGYQDNAGNTHFFEGEVVGKIVPPAGDTTFGWDAIFEPDGINETFAEMGADYKKEFSMRTMAFKKLQRFLEEAQG